MEKSEQINELAGALCKAQSKFTNIMKDNKAKIRTKAGAEYTYSYADLASLLDMVRVPLSENGLSIIQGANVIEGKMEITTMLLHSSGQYLKNTLNLPIVDTGNNAIQAIGSSCTYGRRYELSSILGIASEMDDDAASLPKTYNNMQGKPPAHINPSDIAYDAAPVSKEVTPITPQITMRSLLEKEACKKFKSLEAFQIWRVENGLVESLDSLVDKNGKENGIEFARIIRAVQEYKGAK